jgi:hypothetical protein
MDTKNYHKFGFIRLNEKINSYESFREWDGDDMDIIDVEDSENREIFVKARDLCFIGEVSFKDSSTMWCIRARGDDRSRLVEESEGEIFKQLENIHPSMR